MGKYIKLYILVSLFTIWAKRSGSVCYLRIFSDGSCDLAHVGVDQDVATFPFIPPTWSRQVRWFWEKLLVNEKVEPDWEKYREKIEARYKRTTK